MFYTHRYKTFSLRMSTLIYNLQHWKINYLNILELKVILNSFSLNTI